MIQYIYKLQIVCSTKEQQECITKILDINYSKQNGSFWTLELVENENDATIDFINYFLDILNGKFMELESIGIQRDNISIWFLYQYENQCNMEFKSKDLKRLGENGIDLCISCWNDN
ncbi:hypothetical protein M2138_001962 [Dysgonomonadaceae bacterium PH5-43]|nr:hypothetical protein [Dysgonomonadaceae bacterium PH5-43]